MGQVLLVRHGQASWGAADYDVLSPVGEQQATILGAALAGTTPDLVVHGTMQRQRRTAELVAEAAGWGGDLVTDGRWDEFDHLAVLHAHPEPLDGPPDPRAFQAWYEAATERWTSGKHDADYPETFTAFEDRVETALADLVEARRSLTVVVTSGGPIATVAASLLGGGTAMHARVAPVIVNSSVTLVLSGRRGVTLVSLNEHGHLRHHPDLLTYR